MGNQCTGPTNRSNEKQNDKSSVEFDNIGNVCDNNNDRKYPEPKPSTKPREKILPSKERLKEIDDYVIKTPRYAENSIEKLGKYLLKTTNTDVEKARAIYKWVTENIRYDTDAYFGRQQKSSSGDSSALLRSKSSVCDGYASIFQHLCEIAEIPVKKLSGHAKGYRYRAGADFTNDTPTDHAWNAVYVSGEWRLVDTTWGAGSIGDNKEFKKCFTDFYFLTDPNLFIVDHFPYFDKNEKESARWQLLKRPITLDKFNKRIKPSRHAREWDIKFSSLTVHQPMQESLQLQLESPSTAIDSISAKLVHTNGRVLDHCTTASIERGKCFIKVVPTEVGKYDLEIFGSIDTTSDKLDSLVNYSIECKRCCKNDSPLPEFDHVYGASKFCEERGFRNVGKIPSFIKAKDGELKLTLKVKEGTNVMATLHNSDDVKLVQYTLLEKHGKHLCLKARLTEKGYYRLRVLSQFESDKYTAAFSILVYNQKPSQIQCPFPQTFPETVKFGCRLVEPMTRDLPPSTNVPFKFISSNMTSASVLGEDITKNSSGVWDITVKTPPSGDVRISGNDNDGKTMWVVYSFVVKKPTQGS